MLRQKGLYVNSVRGDELKQGDDRHSLNDQPKNTSGPGGSVLFEYQWIKILSSIMTLFVFLSVAANFIRYSIGVSNEMLSSVLRRFDLDSELNFPAFFSSVIILFASQLFFVIYHNCRERQFERYWLYLSFIFLVLALDEATSMHEQLIEPLRIAFNLEGLLYFSWVLPALLFLLIFVAVYLRFFLSLAVTFRKHFLLSALMYVGGAVGLEMVGGAYAEQMVEVDFTYKMITTLEETLEMMGIILLIHTQLVYIKAQLYRTKRTS